MTSGGPGFELSSVVHLVRPAGGRAGNLETLRVWLAETPAATLFYHTVQVPLRHPTSAELPPDDLSAWVHGVLQDRESAERIAFAVQSRCGSAADLREALLEALQGVPGKDRFSRAAPAESEFVFLAAESVPVPTGILAADPEELVHCLSEAEPGVWFYHLIEQPWHAPGRPPIARWALAHGDARLARVLEEEGRGGRSLVEMRRRVLRRWRQSRLGARMVAASGASETERREASRAAVAGLVRRLTRVADGEPDLRDEP